jgi:hypothetical protein
VNAAIGMCSCSLPLIRSGDQIAGIGAVGGVEPDLAALAGAYVLVMAVTGPLLARAVDPISRRASARATARTG